MDDSNLTILALETSCDETAAAIVRGGREVLANVVASQIDIHRRYGGVVPEVASRQHILAIPAVVEAALAQLPGGLGQVDAVAATYGPGLAGALLTGLNAAKAIAWARDLPFVGVNHIEAHIYANWLATDDRGANSVVGDQSPGVGAPEFPLVALVVSGGHTLLALLEGHGRYRLLGQTRDDAAGEAFDKAARIMGLGFPGGPAIQRAAANAPGGVVLPRAWLRDSYDFSFSGLKTAVLHQIQGRQAREQGLGVGGRAKQSASTPTRPSSNAMPQSRPASERPGQPLAAAPVPRSQPPAASPQLAGPDKFTAQLAYAFQESVVDVLVTKACDAARAYGATEILLAGGVAANERLRGELIRRAPVPVRCPPIALCTDNAAMIAAAAFYRFDAGRQSGWDLDVEPNLRLAS